MKVGWIDFFNTIPFKEAINGNSPYIVIKDVPSRLNRYIYEGIIDIGIISSAEYIENFPKYLILPKLSISSYGKVNSVVLVSDYPIDDINLVVLSKQSKTSNYLVQILFNSFLRKRVVFSEKEENQKDIGYVLIGDKALLQKDKFPFVYDLSDIWYKYTKTPFVFALWCVRKDFYHKNKDKVIDFYKKLLKSKEKFFFSKNSIPENINNYLKNLDFSLKEEHISGLKLFAKYMQKNQIIKRFPEFNFIEP